ncbi:MAG: carboxyltransferase domain-containing protein, partial [Tissierellales bacterium]|nr:carboxyltransferase domain-containing protein [Tissierellales bacterium]
MITYKSYGDKGILIELGKEISEEINNRVVIFSQIIEKENHSHITDVIPSYNSILVIYNPLEISYDDLINNIKSLEKKISKIEKINYKVIHIPVI